LVFWVVSFLLLFPPVSSFPIRATFSDHLNLLNLITVMIVGEEWKSRSSSLCSFLHPPVTSSPKSSSAPCR
jgi:hypothetical protein